MIAGHCTNWKEERAFAHPVLQQALDYLTTTDFSKLEPGKYEVQGDEMVAIVMERMTVMPSDQPAEKHEQYFDIHCLLEGEETIGWAVQDGTHHPSVPYKTEEDTALFGELAGELSIRLTPGMYVVLFPEDIHRPLLAESKPFPVRKVVMKLHTGLFSV